MKLSAYALGLVVVCGAAAGAGRVLGPDDKARLRRHTPTCTSRRRGATTPAHTGGHDKDLHLIVVRRDLSGFQHVHPTRSADGTWTVALSAPTPGQWRVFADFTTAGRELILGADLPVPGDYQPSPRAGWWRWPATV